MNFSRLFGKKLPRVSLGTIYRNLEILTSEKKVRVLEDGNAPRRYDGDIGRHFHVRCVQCGAVSDLVNPVELPIMDTFIDESGYRVTGFHLEFQGICPDCLRSASGKLLICRTRHILIVIFFRTTLNYRLKVDCK